jgi:adenosylcobinamide amidohydrolase
LTDNVKRRDDRVRARAFLPHKPGRKNTGAACARRVHKWNHDSTQKWCTRCGKTVKK